MSKTVVKSKVKKINGTYERVVNVHENIGITALKFGGKKTKWLKIITDKAGKIITTYPIPKP